MDTTRTLSSRGRLGTPSLLVPPSGRWWLAGLFLGVLLPLIAFGSLAAEVWDREGFSWDVPILRAIHTHASPLADTSMIWVSRIGGAAGLVPFCAAAALLLLYRRHARAAVFVVLAYGGAEGIAGLAKLAFHNARPHLWASPAAATGYSFPSGHAIGSMALGTALILVAWRTRWRLPVAAVCMVVVPLVALSRLYLGVHFPSDVLAAWAAALAWVIGLFLMLTAGRRDRLGALHGA